MCQFFSFVTYENRKYFFDDLARIGNEKYDSHSYICKIFRLPEDRCNKYEIINGKLVIDHIANNEELLEDVQAWAESFVASPPFARIIETYKHSLAMLATDPEWYVRQAVAGNPNTPIESLAVLATDPHRDVRLVAAGNPNTPIESLVVLAKDQDRHVRQAAAGNPNTPIESLVMLAKDQDWYVRWSAAKNINTPPESLAVLAKDQDQFVRWAAADNPNIPR